MDKKSPLIVFIVMIVLAIVLTYVYADDYKTAWQNSPDSPLLKYSIIAGIIGFVIISIAIFSALAGIDGGYSVFLVTDHTFLPFIFTIIATLITSAFLVGALRFISIFTPQINVVKVWAVLTLIVETVALIWETRWLMADIALENERIIGRASNGIEQ